MFQSTVKALYAIVGVLRDIRTDLHTVASAAVRDEAANAEHRALVKKFAETEHGVRMSVMEAELDARADEAAERATWAEDARKHKQLVESHLDRQTAAIESIPGVLRGARTEVHNYTPTEGFTRRGDDPTGRRDAL